MGKKQHTNGVEKRSARRNYTAMPAPASLAEPAPVPRPVQDPTPSSLSRASSSLKWALSSIGSVAMLIRALLVGGGFGAGWIAKPEQIVTPVAEPAAIVKPIAKKRPRVKADAAPLGLFNPFALDGR